MALQEVQFIDDNFVLDANAQINGRAAPVSTLFEAPHDRELVPVNLLTKSVSNLRVNDENVSISAHVLQIDLGNSRSPTNLIMVFKGLALDRLPELFVAPVPSLSTSNYSGIYAYRGWRAGAEIFYLYVNPTAESRYWHAIFTSNPGALTDTFLGGSASVNQVVSKGLNHKVYDPSQFVYSDSGRFYAVRRPKYQTITNLRLPFLDRRQVTALKQFSEKKGITEPFWISIDPDNRWDGPSFGATFGAYRFDTMPTFSHAFLDKFTATFNLREVL